MISNYDELEGIEEIITESPPPVETPKVDEAPVEKEVIYDIHGNEVDLEEDFQNPKTLPFCIDTLDEDTMKYLEKVTTPKLTKYIPHYPTPKQAAFLLLEVREGFFGGAASGGKSDALLMAALQHVDEPGYAALLLRRTYADLALPGALMDRMKEWLMPFIASKEVKWIDKDKTYLFPSGATITFGYLEHEDDKYRYQSAEFQFVGFDELTQFTETQYRYLFSRLRRLKGVKIPIRMRSASNPDGTGIEWVHQRFVVEGEKQNRIFIPSKLEDNPYVDQEEYEQTLAELDPLTQLRLRHGVWALDTQVGLFQRRWFGAVDEGDIPTYMKKVRYWDFASTDPKKMKKVGSRKLRPDWSVGLLLGEAKGIYYVLDVRRVQVDPEALEQLVRQTAKDDGYSVRVGIEQEPGSSGQIVIDHYARNVLKGYAVEGVKESGSKVLRATPISAAAKGGRARILRAPWNTAFLDEMDVVPYGEHDDQMDALSGAHRMLRISVSAGAIPVGVGDEESYWTATG